MKFMLVKDGWYKDFEEKITLAMPVSGRMGDYLRTKSDNMDWWKECVGEYDKARAMQNIHHESG
eukprot:6978176-Pyramimonas_sp.AAC.1